MRNRSRSPFFASDTIADTNNQLTVPWATMTKWLFLVKAWLFTSSAVDGIGNPIIGGSIGGSGPWVIGWNKQNNRNVVTLDTFPISEAHLATGWQMFTLDPDFYQHGGVSNIAIDFFSPFELSSNTQGTGAHFDVPANNVGVPFLLTGGGLLSTQSGTSPVTISIDGITMNLDDSGIAHHPASGAITMNPFEYWEYRKSDNTAPMYNATTGAALLPQQTDELP